MITEQGYARVRGVIRRRKLPILVAAAVTLAAGTLAVWRLEPGYRASAVVRALESQPSKEYVAPTVGEQYGERLKTLRLAVMARPVLRAVVRELGLADAMHRSEDEVVDGMRARMEVKEEGEDTFLLSYEDRDPGRAQNVVDRVAAHFIDGEVRRRADVATATVAAIGEEVARLRPELGRVDDQVTEWKMKHYGALPEQQESNLRALDQATMEVNIQATNLDLGHERRRQLLAAAMSPLRHQEDLLETTLHEARTRYTADHPEVHRIAAELEAIHQERLSDEDDLRGKLHRNNPELGALESEIRHTEATIAGLRARQAEVRGRVEATAKNAQELQRITTDYEVIRTRYQTAVGKLHEAELSAGIERGLRGMRFEIVEGASLPRSAAHPNKPMWALGALLLALAVGLAVGFGLDRRDDAIYVADEAIAAIAPRRAPPVLASVPDFNPNHQQ